MYIPTTASGERLTGAGHPGARALRSRVSGRARRQWTSLLDEGYGRVTDEADGHPTRMSGVIYDITDHKQAEQVMHQADRRKDEFLAMLAPIRNVLQVLQVTSGDDGTVGPALVMMSRQVDNSLARSQGGLGLGLTLVRRLVEMHGGT